jgi:Zn-dependent membrane protease YugP
MDYMEDIDMYYDSTILILIPAIILTLIAQFKVRHAYKKYSRIPGIRRYSGAQVARQILDRSGLRDVRVEVTKGVLSDHYDPRKRTVRLSPDVYNGTSVAAVSIAAHESGHAIQHGERYLALTLRSAFAPLASFSSKIFWILLVGGIVLASSGTAYRLLGPVLFDFGILLYAAVLVFQIITLPVEFNASKRAKEQLILCGIVYEDESEGVKKMLSAAALTYVAALAASLLTLVRLLIIRGRD